ncbi:hypothetical protein M2267_001241 [Ensifer sp. KUDG1]
MLGSSPSMTEDVGLSSVLIAPKSERPQRRRHGLSKASLATPP